MAVMESLVSRCTSFLLEMFFFIINDALGEAVMRQWFPILQCSAKKKKIVEYFVKYFLEIIV